MRRITIAFLTLFAVAISPLWVVKADNAHFVRASASINNNGILSVSWKEAGLGSNVLITYTAGADGTANYACFNGGGKHPSASNKESVAGPVTASGTFSSGKNGSISASLNVSPPAATLACPSGQRRVMAYVAYTNVFISDDTTPEREDIPGSFALCTLSAAERAAAPDLCPAG